MSKFDDIRPVELRQQMIVIDRAMTLLQRACNVWLALGVVNAALSTYAVYNGGVSWWSTAMVVVCAGLWWFTDKMLGVAYIEWLKTCPCPECDGFRRQNGLNK